MNFKLLFGVFFLLAILLGCDSKTPEPEGIYQNTSHNTGKAVKLDFKRNGEVYVQVSHVSVSENIVDDTFFPFFSKGQSKFKWKMEGNGRLVSIRDKSDFEIVKLEYTGKSLSWDKAKFTKK
jgi:hypothetical protein